MIYHFNAPVLQTVNQEKIIYSHLREKLAENSYDEVALEFRLIFLEGRSQDPEVKQAIQSVVHSQIGDDKYFYILNYCFYILINDWFDSENGQESIRHLLELFQETGKRARSHNRLKNRTIELSKAFVESKYYARLKRIATVIRYDHPTKAEPSYPIKKLAPRYTFLYKSILLGKENATEVAQFIKQLQENRSKSFEFKLAQHIIYRSRLVEIAKANQLSSGAGRIVRRVANPTFLDDRNLRIALKQYIKRLDGKLTLHQTARKFTLENQKGIKYGQFKNNLYLYLIKDIKPRSRKFNFKSELQKLIEMAYYQSDSQPISESLILQTCRKLYQSLIVSNAEKKQHNLLIKMVSSLGTAQTVMLLIKILLICPQVKPDLEQRLGILFVHYENKKIQEVIWLAKFLEHFSVAFSIYFGKLDISLGKTI